MPEGDSVYQAARRLSAALGGQTITRFDLRVPRFATLDLTGELSHEVVARGKHLLHRIGDYTVHSHLKMEGRWHVYAPGARWRKPEYKARAVIGTATALAVGFEIAEVQVVRTVDEHELVDHLGPDPLNGEWDPAEAARRLGADSRAVHVALQDQRNVAGFGNEYVNEILFLRGVAPTKPATEVDAAAMIDLGARVLRANRDRGPRVFTGNSRPGQTTWVYGRDRRPCRRCGTPIRRTVLGADPTRERIVFWCPTCQR